MARKSKLTSEEREKLVEARRQKQEQYWADRAQSRIRVTDREADAVKRDQERAYRTARDNVMREVDKVYQGFGSAAGMSEEDARQKLSRKEISDFKKELASKIKVVNGMIAKDPENKELQKYVEEWKRLSKVRELTRKEALEANLSVEVAKLGGKQQMSMDAHIKKVVVKSLQMNADDLNMIGNVESKLGIGSPEQVKRAAEENWQHGDFSEIIWNDKTKLIKEMREVIENGFARNKGAVAMATDLMTRMNVSQSSALRVVRTEFNHLSNQASLAEYKEKGIKKYKFVAAIDNRTCSVCHSLHGKEFLVSEAKTGFNFPPIHPNCRSVTVPVIDWGDEDQWDYSGIELDEAELAELGMTADEVKALDASAPKLPADTPSPTITVQQANKAAEDTESVIRKAEQEERIKAQSEALEKEIREQGETIGIVETKISQFEDMQRRMKDEPMTMARAVIEAEQLEDIAIDLKKQELEFIKLQERVSKLDDTVPKLDEEHIKTLKAELETADEKRKERRRNDLSDAEVIEQAMKQIDVKKTENVKNSNVPRSAVGKILERLNLGVKKIKQKLIDKLLNFNRSFHPAYGSNVIKTGFKSITQDQLIHVEDWNYQRALIQLQFEENLKQFGSKDTRTEVIKAILEGEYGDIPNFSLACEVAELQNTFKRITGSVVKIQFTDDVELPGSFIPNIGKNSGKIIISRNAKPSVIHHEMTHAIQYFNDERILGDDEEKSYKIRWTDYAAKHPCRIAGKKVWKALTLEYSADDYIPGKKADKALMEELFDGKSWSELTSDERSIMHAFREIHASISMNPKLEYGHQFSEYGYLNIEAIASIKEIVSYKNKNAMNVLRERYSELLSVVYREWRI